jgi:hypothetical protein
MDRDEMGNRYRRPSIDASYQVSVHLAKRFQRRRFKKLTFSIVVLKEVEYCSYLPHFAGTILFLAHLAKGNVNFCHHLVSVVRHPLTFHILIFSSETAKPINLRIVPAKCGR